MSESKKYTGWAKPRYAALFHFFQNGEVICGGPWLLTPGYLTVQIDGSRPCGECRKRADEDLSKDMAESEQKLLEAIFGKGSHE